MIRPISLATLVALVLAGVANLGCAPSNVSCRYGNLERCTRACANQNAESCTRLGAMTESAGAGDEPPIRHYLRACLLGDGLGCHMAGLKQVLATGGAQSDLQQAQRSFDAACTLKYGNGCAMSGVLLANERPPRTEEATARYKRACELGSPLGCQFMKEQSATLPGN